MTDREALIPENLPYGGRQARRQAFAEAGAPPVPGAAGAPVGGAGPGMPTPGGDTLDDPLRVSGMDMFQSGVAPDAMGAPAMPPQGGQAPPRLYELYSKWQNVAANSNNMMARSVATRVLGRLGDRIQQQDNQLVKALQQVPVKLSSIVGMRGQGFASEAEQEEAARGILNTQMDKLGTMLGVMSKRTYEAIVDEKQRRIRVESINEVTREFTGYNGLQAAFSLGLQAGQFLSGKVSREDLGEMIGRSLEDADNPKVGAFLSGALASHIEYG